MVTAIPSSAAEDKPFDFNRAKELYAKSQRGESLARDEQSFLEEAKRQLQQRTGMSEEEIEKVRAPHEKSRAGETLTADKQKPLDAAKARAGQSEAPPPRTARRDWRRHTPVAFRPRQGRWAASEFLHE